MNVVFARIIWVAIIAVFLIVFFGGRKNKKKYQGQSMDITTDWYEQSQSRYGADTTKKAWYFQPDKNYLTQGHLMVDRNEQTVYEAKVLYGDAVKGYEVDITNHVINYTHHHKVSAVVSTGAGADDTGICATSSFRFDGENVWSYVENLGYRYHLHRVKGLAYQIDVTKDGAPVGTIYSSNTGKNYFDCVGPIVPKAGSTGFYIVECAERDMDALFLLAMAFARTKLSLENLRQ